MEKCGPCPHFFLDKLRGVWYDTSRRKNQNFFHKFSKNVCFALKIAKQNSFTAVENRGFSKRSVMKTTDFPQKTVELWIQSGELKKTRKFLKKSVDKWVAACYYKQALERAGRKRPANNDSAKALCKLNNTKKTRNPDNYLRLKSIFRTVFEKPSLSLSKKIWGVLRSTLDIIF